MMAPQAGKGHPSVSDFAYRLKTAETGAIVLDGDLRVIALSPTVAALLGVDGGRLLGRPLLAMHAPEARARVDLLLAEAREGRQAASMMLPFPGRTLHVRVCPLEGQGGGGFIVILHALGDDAGVAAGAGPATPPASARPLLKIPVESGAVTLFIAPESVFYLQAEGHYCRIQAASGGHFCPLSLADLERRLDAALFFRPHRSFLVNLRHVGAFRRRDGGAELVMSEPDGHVVPVSRSRVGALRDMLAV